MSVSGTPTQAGSFRFTVTATDSRGGAGGVQYHVTIAPAPVTIAVAPLSLPNGVVGTGYAQTITAAGGTGPYTFAVTSGAPPAGLTLTTTGGLSGTPTNAGPSTFTITATDSTNATGTRTYTVTIAQPPFISITPTTLPNGTVGVPYTQLLTATGGVAPFTGSVTGTLPPGLTVDPEMAGASARVSGTPTQAGTFRFTVIATDSRGAAGSVQYDVTIAPAPVTIAVAPLSLPNGVVGTGYAQTIAAAGGTGPYTFAVTSGAPPAGLTLTTTGGLSGTPTNAGPSTFTITATDSTNATGTRTYTVTIAQPGFITITPSTIPNGTVGVPYTQILTATGGVAPFTGSVTAGTLPPGLTVAVAMVGATASVSGTPTQAGTFRFTVTATDTRGATGSVQYNVTIAPAPVTIVVAPVSLPNGVLGTGYAQTITAVGGTAPYTFAVTSGAPPAGLTLTTTGGLSGTPTNAGPSTFTITATDSTNATGTRTYTVTIAQPGFITITPSTIPNGTVGVPYTQILTATGGVAPFTGSVTAGTLPPGLTVAVAMVGATASVSGTPTQAGTFRFTVTATDTRGATGSVQYRRHHRASARDHRRRAALLAGWRRRYELLANLHGRRRHRRLHVCGDDRNASRRTVAQSDNRDSQRDADDGRHLQLHDHGDRYGNQRYGQPPLCADDYGRADADAANFALAEGAPGRDGRRRLYADVDGAGWRGTAVHAIDYCGNAAARAELHRGPDQRDRVGCGRLYLHRDGDRYGGKHRESGLYRHHHRGSASDHRPRAPLLAEWRRRHGPAPRRRRPRRRRRRPRRRRRHQFCSCPGRCRPGRSASPIQRRH